MGIQLTLSCNEVQSAFAARIYQRIRIPDHFATKQSASDATILKCPTEPMHSWKKGFIDIVMVIEFIVADLHYANYVQ